MSRALFCFAIVALLALVAGCGQPPPTVYNSQRALPKGAVKSPPADAAKQK